MFSKLILHKKYAFNIKHIQIMTYLTVR